MRALGGAVSIDEELIVRTSATPDGIDVKVSARPLDLQDATAGLAVMTLCNVTAQKQTVTQLRRSERDFRTLIERLNDAVLVLNAGRVRYMNTATRRLLHLGPDDEVEWLINVVHPDDEARVQKLVSADLHIEHGESPLTEARLLSRAGQTVWVELYAVSAFFDNQTAELAILRDISARKSAEQALAEATAAQKAALERDNARLVELTTMRQRMSGLLVHDLRNPISVIQTNLDYAAEKFQISEREWPEVLGDMQAAIRRILGMLKDLVDIGRAEEGRLHLERQPAVLGELLRLAVDPLRALAIEGKVSIVEELRPGCDAFIDSGLIERVMGNLLANGLRYSPAHKPLRVSLERVEPYYVIAVENQGPRIAPESRQSLFERYGQVSEGRPGTRGLGLYFCRLVVEAHGGTIRIVDGANEIGVRFEVRLPILADGKGERFSV